MSKPVSIRDDIAQIERLENDLKQRCVDALNDNGVEGLVDGVYSIDHLESLLETDLNGRIGIGVSYMGTVLSDAVRGNPNSDPRVVSMAEFNFTVILAVPCDQALTQRFNATTLLAVLRFGILGKSVEVSIGSQRAWQFIQEKPEVEPSTPTMLYYTQVWRLTMPVKGK